MVLGLVCGETNLIFVHGSRVGCLGLVRGIRAFTIHYVAHLVEVLLQHEEDITVEDERNDNDGEAPAMSQAVSKICPRSFDPAPITRYWSDGVGYSCDDSCGRSVSL